MNEIHVRLPDGKTLALPKGASVLAVAEKIGPGLAKAALAGKVNGKLTDLRVALDADVEVSIVTARDPEGAEVLRHSAEHVMADAVKRLFPQVQIDVGRTDHSEKFQYDFLIERPFGPEDLVAIEAEMEKIVKAKQPFVREIVTREAAKKLFSERGEMLKVSRIDDIPTDAEISIFRQGDFIDLCRGPHVQRTDQIGAFRLIDVSGSYWRGDERNPMLQRIYGTAFADKKELVAYLERIEEAKKRDHRRLGPALDLFHLDPISPGSPFFHAKGMIVYNQLVAYMRELYVRYGYDEVMAPLIFNTDLFKTSGHYENFKDDMFLFPSHETEMGLKPMNCPGHAMMFGMRKRSYRELPLRLAEFSRLHRNERAGALQGLTRVRSFAQDDAHIFCRPDQVESELTQFFQMLREVYTTLCLDNVSVAVSTRGERFIGAPERWDIAEKRLVEACRAAGYEPAIKKGEAAFYAPKVEVDVTDVLGRVWTLGTVQLDMAMPERFGLKYITDEGSEGTPEMLHRAILGSLERFFAIYLEHTEGDFPLWLAPVQIVVLPITDRHHAYAQKVEQTLRAAGLRAQVDLRNEKLGYKIREAELHKTPIMAVVGDQEEANGTIAPRRRHDSSESSATSLEALVAELQREVADRRSLNRSRGGTQDLSS